MVCSEPACLTQTDPRPEAVGENGHTRLQEHKRLGEAKIDDPEATHLMGKQGRSSPKTNAQRLQQSCEPRVSGIHCPPGSGGAKQKQPSRTGREGLEQ